MPSASVERGLGEARSDHGFFGHPVGLRTLFFTEMWERFSYYGMRAILILFMTAPAAAGGLGLDTPTAGAVYGMYTAMVYMMSLPGGWIADRLIGQRRAVLYGGVLITAGHFSMAVPARGTFYLGLVLIVLGTGLLKPNISVMVGQLYGAHDNRRDAGFSIFYMGINAGAFFAPFVCGYLGQTINWHYGFGAAGVGMTLGLLQYVAGARGLGDAGLEPGVALSPAEHRAMTRRVWLAIAVTLLAIAGAGAAVWRGTVTITTIADVVGYLLLLLCLVFFAWLFLGGTWTPAERGRLWVLFAFFVAAALFWSVYEQAGSTLTLFADRSTRNSLFGHPFESSYYQSINPILIMTLAPVLAWLWVRLGPRDPSSPIKFAIALIGVGAGVALLIPAARIASGGTLVGPGWLATTYLIHTVAELCLSPVGLSSMTKLAPARIVSLMMGVWFLGASVGNYISGRLAGLYDSSLPLAVLFQREALFAVACGGVMLLFAPRFTRMMAGVK